MKFAPQIVRTLSLLLVALIFKTIRHTVESGTRLCFQSQPQYFRFELFYCLSLVFSSVFNTLMTLFQQLKNPNVVKIYKLIQRDKITWGRLALDSAYVHLGEMVQVAENQGDLPSHCQVARFSPSAETQAFVSLLDLCEHPLDFSSLCVEFLVLALGYSPRNAGYAFIPYHLVAWARGSVMHSCIIHWGYLRI